MFGLCAVLRRHLSGAWLAGMERWALWHRLLLPYDLPRARRLIVRFAALGSPRVASATVALASAVLARRVSRRAGAGLLLSAGVVPASRALKHRWAANQRALDGVRDDSAAPHYPSGHVAYAVSVFGYLGLIARREGHPVGCGVAAFVLIGVGPARALDGTHLVADVLGGYSLGMAWLLFTVALTETAGPA